MDNSEPERVRQTIIKEPEWPHSPGSPCILPRPRPAWRSVMCVLSQLWTDDQGQDIAEYAVILAAILVIVVGTIRLVGSNANTVFSEAASSIQ